MVEQASEDPTRFEPGAVLRAGGEDVQPTAAPGEYYVFDLVGLEVEEEGGRKLGVVTDVVPGPANDALELDTAILLPLVEACVRQVDLDGRRILVAPGFAPPDN